MRLKTVDEVAKILNVNPKTVRMMARSGDLHACNIGGKRHAVFRFTDEAIENFISRGGRPMPDFDNPQPRKPKRDSTKRLEELLS